MTFFHCYQLQVAITIPIDCEKTNSALDIVSDARPLAYVTCPPGCASAARGIWGTSIYTYDSSICKAAIHAGVVTNSSGGTFLLNHEEGQATYGTGSTANGVTSSAWDKPWTYSFDFDEKDHPWAIDCNTVSVVRPPEEGGLQTALVECPSGCSADPHVWGTGLYTFDSEVCASAIHGGFLTDAGGTVEVLFLPGQSSYTASLQNGIQSVEWGEYRGSMGFTAAPENPVGTTGSLGGTGTGTGTGTTNVTSTGTGTGTPSSAPPVGIRTSSGNVRFEMPTAGGLPLDWCRSFRTDCGAAAAEFWCQWMGYDGAGAYEMLGTGVDRTYLPYTGETCILNVNNAVCNTFSSIECTGGGPEARYEDPTYRGVPLDWCRSFAEQCGQPAALQFCQLQGWTGLKDFGGPVQVTSGCPGTLIANQNSVCDPAYHVCHTFSYIECM